MRKRHVANKEKDKSDSYRMHEVLHRLIKNKKNEHKGNKNIQPTQRTFIFISFEIKYFFSER